MKIVWNALHRIRGFHAVPTNRVTIVSEHIVDDARTVDFGGNLTVVTDNGFGFCDLELVLDKNNMNADLPFSESAEQLRGLLETVVPCGVGTTWWFDETVGHLRIGFAPVASVAKWYQLGTNRVWLGVGVNGELTALVADNVRFDGAGTLESSWLDEIGAGDE